MHVYRADSPSAILIPLAEEKNQVSRSHMYDFDIEVNQILFILPYPIQWEAGYADI